MANNTICKSQVAGAQCPLSRSYAGDSARGEVNTWWPFSSFKTKQSPGAATPADTDPAEVTGFCQNSLPRSSQLEDSLHCDRKYSKPTTCRLDLAISNKIWFYLIYLHSLSVPSLSDFLIWGDFENLSDPGRIQWSRVAKSPTRHADFGFIELWENPFISQWSASALGQTTPTQTWPW